MNYKTENSELLKAFFEPIINDMVEECVKKEVEKRLASIKFKNEPERPILIEEAAKMLGYSQSHMYTLCRNKSIPYTKKGRWLHFYVSELNEWLKG